MITIIPRTKVKRIGYHLSPMINAETVKCSAADDSILNDLKAKLIEAERIYMQWNTLYEASRPLKGNVGGCGLGRSLSHWLDKYPQFRVISSEYGKQTYCEPNFIDATLNLLRTHNSQTGDTVLMLRDAVATEQQNYDNAVANYEACLKAETEATEAEAVQQQAKATATTAQTELTQAETQQIQVKEEAGILQTTPKWLPYAGLGIGILGLGYAVYSGTKNKKRR